MHGDHLVSDNTKTVAEKGFVWVLASRANEAGGASAVFVKDSIR
jgi:hypothetical protein